MVDKELCVSSGRCVADVPEVFEFDGDELAQAAGDPGAVDAARLKAVARNCPGQAITVEIDAPRS